jgi:hypothetical protein
MVAGAPKKYIKVAVLLVILLLAVLVSEIIGMTHTCWCPCVEPTFNGLLAGWSRGCLLHQGF